MFAVLFGGVVALLPIFAGEILKVGASGLGILSAADSIGAMIGGFCEYLSMIVGNQNLMFLIIAAYLVSCGLQMRLTKTSRI